MNGGRIQRLPGVKTLTNPKNWWAYIIVALGILMVLAVYFDESYRAAFDYIWPGVQMTMFLTIVSFSLALVIGLFTGLARVSTNPILYNISTFYVETIRRSEERRVGKECRIGC